MSYDIPQGFLFERSSDVCQTPVWNLDMTQNPYGDTVRDAILDEAEQPVVIDLDKSLRPKIIDACGLTCTFCHNEGTPVAADNIGKSVFISRGGRSGRVSVYAEQNGVDFIPGKMLPDEKFTGTLAAMRDIVGLTELHFTGGEPTLHGQLPELVIAARGLGFSTKITSNGQRGATGIADLAEAGLKKINFSIFGTTPEELASVQNDRFQDIKTATNAMAMLNQAIETAQSHGLGTDANIVMRGPEDGIRIQRLLDEYAPELSVRILNDLDNGAQSIFAIYSLLRTLKARPVETHLTAGSSNARVKYELPDGRYIHFKQIRPVRLHNTCTGCRFNNGIDCSEGFYGVRMYVDREGEYRIGVCLKRMDLTTSVDEFFSNGLAEEVKQLRETDLQSLQNSYGRTDE